MPIHFTFFFVPKRLRDWVRLFSFVMIYDMDQVKRYPNCLRILKPDAPPNVQASDGKIVYEDLDCETKKIVG